MPKKYSITEAVRGILHGINKVKPISGTLKKFDDLNKKVKHRNWWYCLDCGFKNGRKGRVNNLKCWCCGREYIPPWKRKKTNARKIK